MTTASPLNCGPVQFWGKGWFWCLLALGSLIPFILAPLPMMPDYLSHLARYHIMNHGETSAFLPRYYEFKWALIGNLGVDLLMVPLGAIWPTEIAGRIAAACIPVLTIAGIYAVSRAAWGRVEAPALLALPFVFSFTFLYGFVNYHLAVALALLSLAAWIKLASQRAIVRWLVFVPLAALVWVAHVAGWAVLLLLVACWEFVAALEQPLTWRAARQAIASSAIRALPVALPILLTLLWRDGQNAMPQQPFIFLKKALWILWAFRAEYKLVDYVTLYLLVFSGLWLNGHLNSRHEKRLRFGALMIFVVFLALPQWVFNSNFADMRLLPVFGMIFFIALGAPTKRSASVLAMLGVTLFSVRLITMTIGWQQRSKNAVAELKSLEKVPVGARIAVLRSESICGPWILGGLDHLASLAIIRREAFVNTQWDFAGAQLMRPIYNEGHGFNSSSSGLVNTLAADCGQPVPEVIAAIPRNRFDFVWAMDTELKETWLQPVATGPSSHLYKIQEAMPVK
jgi:hypothetical protein